MATLYDVCRKTGLSTATVSRVINGSSAVTDKTRKIVQDAMKELGYSPNALASSLTTGRTKLIGLISNNFHNPIFLEVFDQFTRALQERVAIHRARPIGMRESDRGPSLLVAHGLRPRDVLVGLQEVEVRDVVGLGESAQL